MKEILIQTIDTVIYLAVIFIIVRAVLSFFPVINNREHPVVRYIYILTDPLLNPFRNILPTSRIGIDFSPLLAYFVLEIIRVLLLTIVDKIFS